MRYLLLIAMLFLAACAAGDGDDEEDDGFDFGDENGSDSSDDFDDSGDFGDSDDSEFSDFSGRWRGSASITTNTCGDFDAEQNYEIDLNIEKNSSEALVALKVQEGAVVMEGAAGTTRLFADVDVQDEERRACNDGPATVNFSVDLRRIEEDLANVTFQQRVSCLNSNATCRITYFGTIEQF